MHHSIKPEEIRDVRDQLFAEYWREQGAPEMVFNSEVMEVFREVAEHAFRQGFYLGLCRGCDEGAKLATAGIAADIEEIMNG